MQALHQGRECFGVDIYEHCLMPNHVHLAIYTPQSNLSRFMAWLQTTVTVRYSRNHKRSRHVCQERYSAELVDSCEWDLNGVHHSLWGAGSAPCPGKWGWI